MSDELPKIGQKIVGEQPAVFELVVEDHVPFVNPHEFGLHDERGVDPRQYFITSGDAVEKAKVLERDFWSYAGELRRRAYDLIAAEHKVTIQAAQVLYRKGIRPRKPKKFGAYEIAVWKAAGQSRSLLHALRKAKGDNIHLETEWNADHKLLCIPKNPRK